MLHPLRCALVCTLLLMPALAHAEDLLGTSAGVSRMGDAAEDQIKDKVLEWVKQSGWEFSSQFSGAVDNLVISPLVSYFTTVNDDTEEMDGQLAADNQTERYIALFLKLAEGGVKLAMPEQAFVIDGGRMTIGGLVVAGNVAAEAGRVGIDTSVRLADFLNDYSEGGPRRAAEKLLFGTTMPLDDYVGGNVNELFREHSFFDTYAQRLGITADNVGDRIATKAQLEDLFKVQYKTWLKSTVFSLPSLQGEIDPAIEEAWPYVLDYWRIARAADAAAKLEHNFILAMQQLEPLKNRMRQEAALKALQCPASSHSEPLWLENERKAACWCSQGYLWNAEHTECVQEPAAQVANLQCASGEEPYWDPSQEKAVCRGAEGSERASPEAAGLAVPDDIARMQRDLACLKEGKRKVPDAEVDCNGSYMIGSRDGKIEYIEAELRKAGYPPAPDNNAGSPQRNPDGSYTDENGYTVDGVGGK
jgi:hypothetical protein